MTSLTNKKLLITIAIPVCNEEGSLPELRTRLKATLEKISDYRFEILFIDNGSTDNSGKICKEICSQEKNWKYIQFSRNFGIEASFYAGASYAKGDALIYLFSDLQDPPEAIPTMIEKWQEGYDVVYGILSKRQDHNITKTWGAWVAYRLIYLLSDVKIPVNATDFRLLSRPVINALVNCRERKRYMRGITHWAGFKQVGFEFERSPRKHGETNAGLMFCITYTFSAVFSFSVKPIRVASIVGALTMILSIFGAIGYALLTYLTRTGIWDITPPPTGISTIVLLIFFFGGVQCLFLGILGEYITQIHSETKNRPLWLIKDQVGLEEQLSK